VGSLRYDAAALAALLLKLESGEITRVQAKDGLEGLASTGELPSFDSGGDLGAVLDALLVDKADELARYRGGERKLLGFFMGEAMRASKGAFDPGDVRKTLQTKLDG
jgi:Asp-tRNA(Asn)/Glu-tRNA(Gln) amidotransferase B subunit